MKKYILYTLVIIVVFMGAISLLRRCTDSMIELSGYSETSTTLNKDEKFELDKPIKIYNLNTYEDWEEYIGYLLDKIDYKFSKFIDKKETIDYNYKHSQENQERNGETFINLYMHTAYLKILKDIFYQNGDWTDYPLTEKFLNKFNERDGVGKYYNIPEEDKEKNITSKININTTIKKIDIDVYEVKDIYNDIYGKYDIYHLLYTLDGKGYIDDVQLNNIEPVNDENGVYILKKDKYLMTDESAKSIIYNICLYNDYLLKYGYSLIEWENWLTDIEEIGMTDRFREYFLKNDGILPIKNFSNIEIMNIDVEDKLALIKIETENKCLYYDIKWTTDNKLRIDTVDVKLNYQEKE